MDILTTWKAGSFGGTGKVFWRRRTAGSLTQKNQMTVPSDFNLTDTRASWCIYGNRLYGAGLGTDNVVIDENFRFMRQGIQPPKQVPTLAAAAGPGVTGKFRVAIAFYDRLTGEWSPLSDPSAEVTLSNAKRLVGNIQTTAEPRVSDVGIWVSYEGGAYRLATMRQIGVSSVTEGVSTLLLGAAFPRTFTRMPRHEVNTIYHERYIGAVSFEHPDTLFVSAIGRPERYEGLSFKTKGGEPITALINVYNDICLVMTAVNAYVLRGWRDNDMSLTPLDPDVGCIGQSFVDWVHGKPVVVNRHGFWVYNGAFHCISRDRATEWSTFYKSNRAALENNGIAVVDPNEYTYALYITGATTPDTIPNPASVTIGTLAWVFDYRPIVPQISGEMGQPHWYYDVCTRIITSVGRLTLPGTARTDVYLGDDSSFVRGKDATNSDDDGDTYGKRMWIRLAANHMGDPGGFSSEGKEWTSLWTHMQSESSAWTVYFRGGDEEAWKGILPDNNTTWWRENVAASELVTASYRYTPQTIHPHIPARVAGRCLTADYNIPTPLNVYWRGFGGVWIAGQTSRPPSAVVVGS